MTERPVIGILLILLVESPHWLKFRWDFDDSSFGRAWQLTTVAILLSGVWIVLDSGARVAMPNLLSWLPPLLVPMQFVQSFGLENSIPLNTFSLLSKYRRRRNLRLGLTEAVTYINFGNVYFVSTMVAATLGSGADSWAFLPGVIVLTGWMLLSASRSRPLSLVVALSIAGCIALAGQFGLRKLDEMFTTGGAATFQFDPNSISTRIGKPGPIVQSPDVVWRLAPQDKKRTPPLVRTATYNSYYLGTWKCTPMEEMKFKDLDTRSSGDQNYWMLGGDLTESEQMLAIDPKLPRFILRGSAVAETPLALPGDASSLRDFELDGVERNSFGTVRVFPKHSVIAGSVLWKGERNPENQPFVKEDLAVPPKDRETFRKIIEGLDLDTQPTLAAKLAILRTWFRENFTYSKSPTISSSSQVVITPSPIAQFLTSERRGHCEYFASASALLLREAGIPTRYATGYAVAELDVKRKEFILRGTHAHAWCRVWDAEKSQWLDFDTTPGTWLASITPAGSATQRFNDELKRLRENFFLWRNQPNNRIAVTVVMIGIGVALVVFLGKRLWKSKRMLDSAGKADGYTGVVRQTPLNALEHKAEKFLGARPLGQPFGAWFMQLSKKLPDSATLQEAIELHQRLRFDPDPADEVEQKRLAALASQLEKEIRSH
jgi:protein-glutamine gamma-glutamyltransferase